MGAAAQVRLEEVLAVRVRTLEAALERQLTVSEADTVELVLLEECNRRLELQLAEAEAAALLALRVRASLESRVRELEDAVAVRDAQYAALAQGALKALRQLKGGAQ